MCRSTELGFFQCWFCASCYSSADFQRNSELCEKRLNTCTGILSVGTVDVYFLTSMNLIVHG